MILTPLETFRDCDDELLRDFVAEQAETRNAVVIVPSEARAGLWEDRAQAIHTSSGLERGLAELRDGHVGLVVLVNKYDGIDLPGDACRLLVIDGLPEALGTLDRLELEALEGSDTLVTRQVQRIEQGMGRGIRSNEDYCAVLLLDTRLTARLHKARNRFSAATQAQLNLSDEVAKLLEGRPFEDLGAVVGQCLDRDPKWIAASRSALDGITYPEHSVVAPTAEAERKAFDLANEERYPEAADCIQQATNGFPDPRLRGFLKEEAATYLHQADPAGAQALQGSAYSDTRALTRPRRGVTYTRLRESRPQAQAAVDFLRKKYEKPDELVLGVAALLAELTPSTDPTAVPSFEQAMRELGEHLGLSAQRPEQEAGRGPDVLWLLGDSKFWVIECKSGSTQQAIPKHDMAQLSHSIDWFAEAYEGSNEATPILVHPSRDLDERASAGDQTRILTFAKLTELRKAVEGFAAAVAAHRPYCEPKGVWERLVTAGLNGEALKGRWTVSPRSRR